MTHSEVEERARRWSRILWGRLWVWLWCGLGKTANALLVAAFVAGLGGAISFLWKPAIDHVFDYLGQQLGIAAMAEDMAALAVRVTALEPREPIAIYDPNLSYIEGDSCRQAGVCVARYRVHRTESASGCGAPALVPVVRNHGGREHVAEALSVMAEHDGDVISEGQGGVGVVAATEWTVVTVRFRVPQAARPGRGVFTARLLYTCSRVRLPPIEATPLPFRILPAG